MRIISLQVLEGESWAKQHKYPDCVPFCEKASYKITTTMPDAQKMTGNIGIGF